MHGRGVRDSGTGDRRSSAGAICAIECRHPIAVDFYLAKRIEISAADVAADASRNRCQGLCNRIWNIDTYRLGGASLHRVLRLHKPLAGLYLI